MVENIKLEKEYSNIWQVKQGGGGGNIYTVVAKSMALESMNFKYSAKTEIRHTVGRGSLWATD